MATVAEYTGVDNLEVMQVARNYNQFLVDQVLTWNPGGTQCVDFGAGTGTFAAALRDQGLDVQCVEADGRLRDHLHDQGFIACEEVSELDEVAYVFTLNVLEHIEDDQAALDRLYDTIRPGGRLYAYVPAFQILYSSMDKKVGHFRRYSHRMLVDRMEQAGFEILRWEYVDSLGFFVSLLYRAIGNRRGDISEGSIKFYDRFLFPVSRWLDLALGRWFGKNVAVVGRRPV